MSWRSCVRERRRGQRRVPAGRRRAEQTTPKRIELRLPLLPPPFVSKCGEHPLDHRERPATLIERFGRRHVGGLTRIPLLGVSQRQRNRRDAATPLERPTPGDIVGKK